VSTLAQLEARAIVYLYDSLNENFPAAAIDEGLRLALHEYTEALPLTMDTVIELPADGHEIALNALTNLIDVVDVWWPYDSLTEIWPPNRVTGYRVYWDDAQPVLVINQAGIGLPMQDDEMRVFYTTIHTINGLDSGDSTTIPAVHESVLLRGAEGHACLMRGTDLTEQLSINRFAVPNYTDFGNMLLLGFRAELRRLAQTRRSSEPFGVGWALDQHDTGAG
jgi:hypothetical protein